MQRRTLLRRVLRRVLETGFEKVLRRVLRRCLAMCLQGGRVLRRVLRRGSKKGLSRRHLEGRNTPFREYDPVGVRPNAPAPPHSMFFFRYFFKVQPRKPCPTSARRFEVCTTSPDMPDICPTSTLPQLRHLIFSHFQDLTAKFEALFVAKRENSPKDVRSGI